MGWKRLVSLRRRQHSAPCHDTAKIHPTAVRSVLCCAVLCHKPLSARANKALYQDTEPSPSFFIRLRPRLLHGRFDRRFDLILQLQALLLRRARRQGSTNRALSLSANARRQPKLILREYTDNRDNN